jgi:hypothetical protein
MGLAAMPANAVTKPGGNCGGSTALATVAPGLTDTTQHITVKSKLLKAIDGAKQLLAGTCDNTKADPLAPPNPLPAGQPPSQMTPKAESTSLVGSGSCVGATDLIDDTNAANAFTLSGKLAATMNQLDGNLHPWVIQAYVAILGGGTGLDTFDLGGIVTKGASVGARISGGIWEDPAFLVSKTKRTIHDLVTTNTGTLVQQETVTSATANFTALDVGSAIVANHILPAGTTIASVTNATTAVLSAAALTTAGGQTAAIGLSSASPGYNHSGYVVDPNTVALLGPCLDNNAATHVASPGLQIALVGGGTGTNSGVDPLQKSPTSPLLASAEPGLVFTFGE